MAVFQAAQNSGRQFKCAVNICDSPQNRNFYYLHITNVLEATFNLRRQFGNVRRNTKMDPRREAFLNKMKVPNYPELAFDFAFKLTNESERGAILIGTGKVEEYLEKLILAILPVQTNSYTSKLLKYPGPLSSLSGKIELLYAFRIIDKRFYDSLNTLRKHRNSAAHSSEIFTLQAVKVDLEKIYDFADAFKEIVHKFAYDALIKFKKNRLRQNLAADKDLKDFDHEKLWDEHVPDPENDETVQEHLTIWKLAYGLTFLSLMIEVITDEFRLKYSA
ncbi:MAG: hypothetical protein ACXVPN_03930 [Bacteroidia bacterium]